MVLEKLNICLDWIARCITGIVIVFSLWLFGAWEMWYFWPFAGMLALGLSVLGLKAVLYFFQKQEVDDNTGSKGMKNDAFMIALILSVPFLIYALVRFLQTDVFMTAERSLLLFVTPVVLAAMIRYCFTTFWRRKLYSLIFFNLIICGLYGVANYFITDNNYVLWRFWDHYQLGGVHRASASLFCPDHFAGVMELLFCMGVGILFTKQSSKVSLFLGGFSSLLAIICIILSKSRGGGLTLAVLFGALIIWGFGQFDFTRNICNRISIVCAVFIVAFLFMKSEAGYAKRFRSYFTIKNIPAHQSIVEAYVQKLSLTSRGRMYGGAFRAWKSAPLLGVGPGMHQIVWPAFAATEDGDREAAKWPSVTNLYFHSYEVHSDWIQLLEEYGMIGFILFIIPMCYVFYELRRKFMLVSRVRTLGRFFTWKDDFPRDAIQLGTLLCFVCMVFHSLGDFNLQIPGVLWTFSGIVAVGLTTSDVRYKKVKKKTDENKI